MSIDGLSRGEINRLAFEQFIETEAKIIEFTCTTYGSKYDYKKVEEDEKDERVGLRYKIDVNGRTKVVGIRDCEGSWVYIDMTNGNYINFIGDKMIGYAYEEHITDKSNLRRYKSIKTSIKKIMAPDYWFVIALAYRVFGFEEYKRDFKLWVHGDISTDGKRRAYEINHISGDSLNSALWNLEVTSRGLNNAHGRLMSEIHNYDDSLVDVKTDCYGIRHLKFVNGTGISCKAIEEFNSLENGIKIKAFKDKDGKFEPRYSTVEMKKIIDHFGIA